MPKNTPPKKEAQKIPKNFRLFAEDVRRLKLGPPRKWEYPLQSVFSLPSEKVRERRDLINLTDDVPDQTPDDFAGCVRPRWLVHRGQ
jgi:hypothetical protein